MTRKNDNTSGTYVRMSQYMQWYMTCTTCNVYMKAGKVYDESEMLELQCSNVQMIVEPVADVGNYCCNVPSTASIQYRMFNETFEH